MEKAMKTDVLFSSRSDLWETPKELFDELNAEFHFNLDVCALSENAKCDQYYTPEQDGLSQPLYGRCWCNPPYGRQVWRWVEKAARSALEGATVVMLLPARTDTRWFHRWIYRRAEVRFLPGRLKFNGANFLVIMIVYCIQVVWSKISACAKNTMEYLQNKQDFEVYKADVLHWDMAKREKALRCRECVYRKKYMEEEAQP